MNITRFKRLGRLMRDARLWKRSPVILASVTPLVFGSTPALYAQVFIGPGNPLPPGSVLPADTTYIVQNGGIIGAGSSTEPSLTSNNTFINVETGGFIDNFFTSNARGVVTLEGGSIGDIFEANNNVLDIQSGSIGLEPYFNFSNAVMSGGSIGDRLQLRNNSVLGLFGGSIGDDASVYINSTLNVSGGSVGDEWTIAGSSTLNLSGGSMGGMGIVAGVANISGGSLGSSWSSFFDGITNVSGTSASLGDDIRLEDDSTLNLAGGFVGPQFQAYNNSTVNVFGTGFQVGGVPQNLSTTGGVKVVSQFNGDILSGKLRDNLNNSSNLFELRDTFAAGQDYFQTGTTLRLIEAPDATGFDNVIYSALTDVSNLPPSNPTPSSTSTPATHCPTAM